MPRRLRGLPRLASIETTRHRPSPHRRYRCTSLASSNGRQFAPSASCSWLSSPPDTLARFGNARQLAGRIRMPMPETAVDEVDLPSAGKDQVGRAGQVAAMQAEAIAKRVDEAAHGEFRAGVLSANARHAFRALDRTENIHLIPPRMDHRVSHFEQCEGKGLRCCQASLTTHAGGPYDCPMCVSR